MIHTVELLKLQDLPLLLFNGIDQYDNDLIVFDPLDVSLPIVCHKERLNIRDLFRSKTDVGRRSVAPREGNRPEAIDNVESACKRFDRSFVAETGSCAFGPADDNAAGLRGKKIEELRE